MSIKEIKELLVLMQDHGLAELELEKDGLKIKLTKNTGGRTMMVERGIESPMIIPVPVGEPGVSALAKSAKSPAEAADVFVVKSPMVGTFYSAPAPDQPPYASPGQKVKDGDVLCIIEAMKLMNEIKCEMRGTVIEVLVNNGQAVEFDQPLFKVKKD